ncbi:MAG: AraC family transcriptional regulator [Bacteroidota bacterium]
MTQVIATIFLKVELNAQTILAFCALLGLAWAYFLIIHRRGNLRANRFLALLLISLAVLIIRQTFSLKQDEGFSLFFYFLSQGIIYLVGPAIYLHLTSITGKKLTNRNVLLHFLPAIVSTIFMVILYFFRIEIKQINNMSMLQVFSVIFISLQIMHLILYLFLSRSIIRVYEGQFGKYYSSLSKINLKWMKQLIITASLFAVLIITMFLLIISGGYYEINNTADFLFLALIATLIVSIVMKSWKQPEVISGIYQEPDKYKTSPLSDHISDELKKKLEKAMKEDQLYLSKDLNLNSLAEYLAVQPYMLSQLINQEYDQNFFHFVNGFRIEHALVQMDNGALKTTTLAGIAENAGFNSKSTFNRAFKKKMRTTPKEYLARLTVD